jgi:hypothetical protein
LVEYVVHGVEIGYGGGDGQGLVEAINRLGHEKVDKGTSVLSNKVGEGKLGLSKEDKLCGEREREGERRGRGRGKERERESQLTCIYNRNVYY